MYLFMNKPSTMNTVHEAYSTVHTAGQKYFWLIAQKLVWKEKNGLIAATTEVYCADL